MMTHPWLDPFAEKCAAPVPGIDPAHGVGCELPLWHDGMHALVSVVDGKLIAEWADPVPPAVFLEPRPVELVDTDPGFGDAVRGLVWGAAFAVVCWGLIFAIIALGVWAIGAAL